MMRIVHVRTGRGARFGAAGVLVAVALTGCGGSGSATSAAATSAPSAASTTGGPGGGRQGRFDPAELQKIRDCLTAAGIPVPTPSEGLRTFNPSDRPSGPRPSGTRPSGSRPSGAPSGGFRGPAGGMFTDPKVRAALEACGITLPTRPPTRTGAAGQTPVPTTTG